MTVGTVAAEGGVRSSPRVTRNIVLLGICETLRASQTSLLSAFMPWVGLTLATTESLATLPSSLIAWAILGFTFPGRYLMMRYGTKAALLVAAMAGTLAALFAAGAVRLHSFTGLCVAAVVLGCSFSFASYYRFVAADQAPAALKSRALSAVMVGGVAAAFVGPNLARYTRTVGSEPEFLGSLLSLAALSAVTALAISALVLPAGLLQQPQRSGFSLGILLREPRLLLAVAAGGVGHSTMVLLMTAAPLAMHHEHKEFGDIAFVIQWHFVAMFAPSLGTGRLIARFGSIPVLVVGLLLEAASIAAGVALHSEYAFALFLLGVGWNLVTVAAATLLVEAYREEHAGAVQAFNNLVVNAAGALSAFAAGALMPVWGWGHVNWAAVPGIAVLLVLIARTTRFPTRRPSI